MDFRITIDISERLEAALTGIADAIKGRQSDAIAGMLEERNRRLSAAGFKCVPCNYEQPAQAAPEPVAEPEPVVVPLEPEIAPTEATQAQESAVAHEPANNDAPAPEPEPVAEKPKKKTAKKKPVEAPEPAPEPEAPVTQPTPEPVVTAPTAPQEAAKSDGDPMAGMTVVDAVQALVSEIQDKGIDMASVNARVRAKANEIGLTYASAACLIKAIGYVEARRVALGEK
jgi:outer membrane biosynthesis protein TonB